MGLLERDFKFIRLVFSTSKKNIVQVDLTVDKVLFVQGQDRFDDDASALL